MQQRVDPGIASDHISSFEYFLGRMEIHQNWDRKQKL